LRYQQQQMLFSFGGLPGFMYADHSALKIEKAENVFDQSRMKYLALTDKRFRKHSW